VKNISVALSQKATDYFVEIAKTLEGENVSDQDVVNYAFETLKNLEELIGDPETFLQKLEKKEIIIFQVPNKNI
jgi:hypothetical protein